MRHTIGQLMPDLVLGCLHQALPGRVPAEGASCMWDIPIRSAALSRLDGNATAFATELTHNGGTGARPRADGRLGRISLRSGRRLTGKGEHVIPEGDGLVFETPGGGGYGNPLEREASDVASDVARGLVGREAAERCYGVVLDAHGSVDENATRARRRAGVRLLNRNSVSSI